MIQMMQKFLNQVEQSRKQEVVEKVIKNNYDRTN